MQMRLQRGFIPYCASCFQVVVVHRASLEATKLTRKNQDNYIYVGTSLFFFAAKGQEISKANYLVLNSSKKRTKYLQNLT